MKFLLYFIGIALITGVFLYSIGGIETNENEGESLFSSEIENSTIDQNSFRSDFSIELTDDDKELRMIIGGRLFIQNNEFSFPGFLEDIFKKQDGVIISLENQVFDTSLSKDSNTKNIVSKELITKLSQSHISHVISVSHSLFSRGQFFSDLTIGNLFSSPITPLYWDNNEIIKKGNKEVAILSLHVQDHSESEIETALKNLQKNNRLVIVLVDFANPTSKTHSLQMKEFSHFCIERGANIVMGIDNQNILPIERYDNGVIFYSLGTIHDFKQSSSKGIFSEIVLSPDSNKIYIHPFHYTNNSNKSPFIFFSLLEKFEFFSQSFFINFSAEEIKNIQNGIEIF